MLETGELPTSGLTCLPSYVAWPGRVLRLGPQHQTTVEKKMAAHGMYSPIVRNTDAKTTTQP